MEEISEQERERRALNKAARVAARRLMEGGTKGREEEGVTQALRDMRWVYRSGKEEDVTPGQHLCRKLMEDSPEKFLDRLMRYEALHEARAAKAVAGNARETAAGGREAPLKNDKGEERVLELIDRLLEEWNGK